MSNKFVGAGKRFFSGFQKVFSGPKTEKFGTTKYATIGGVNPTDNDLKFITKAAPGLTKSVEGNRLMIKALKLSNARRIDEHNFDMDYYNNPETENTIFQRDRAFAEHMRQNPQLYTAQSLIQEYNNLLEREAAGKLNSEEFTSTDDIDLPKGF